MFKLVGKETFPVGSADTKATINIEAINGFAYEYSLEINGKHLQTFLDNRSKISKTWVLKLDGNDCRIVLGKKSHTNINIYISSFKFFERLFFQYNLHPSTLLTSWQQRMSAVLTGQNKMTESLANLLMFDLASSHINNRHLPVFGQISFSYL